VLLKLEGKITEQWAALLDDVCRPFLRQEKTVHLDCANVDFIDARGVDILNGFPREQVILLHAPGYVMELLQTEGRS